jgi:hypothetical protein
MTFCKEPVISDGECIRSLGFTYTAGPDPVLVESTPFDDFGFEAVVQLWHKLECKSLFHNR